MDILATMAKAKSEIVEDAVRFEVAGSPRVVEALHRMLPAHTPCLDAETGWTTDFKAEAGGMTVIVQGETEVIGALGFHGLMTIGARRQEQHSGIATCLMARHWPASQDCSYLALKDGGDPALIWAKFRFRCELPNAIRLSGKMPTNSCRRAVRGQATPSIQGRSRRSTHWQMP